MERDGGIHLDRECPRCGIQSVPMSRHPWYYRELDGYYFSLMDRDLPQRDHIVRLTEKCNLNCPICLASANDYPVPDLDAQVLFDFARSRRRQKFDLMSAEPTLREDLPHIIRRLKSMGHITALHTNGLKIADVSYLQSLIEAGLDEVHLQLDGFEDTTHLELRGQPLARQKAQALENLERFNVATDLVMVIKPGLNEHEIPAMYQYALAHSFVRELFFLGLRSLGKARNESWRDCLTPDEVIDIVAEQLGEDFSRRGVLRFQKLYFALLSLLGVRKCLYVQHYLVRRERGDGIPVDRWFSWDKVEKHLDRLPSIPRKNKLARLWWFLGLCRRMFSTRTVLSALDLLRMRIWSGFDLSATTGRNLIIGYITACDPFIYDGQVARFCGKGEIAPDVGIHSSGADANIQRERFWKEKQEN